MREKIKFGNIFLETQRHRIAIQLILPYKISQYIHEELWLKYVKLQTDRIIIVKNQFLLGTFFDWYNIISTFVVNKAIIKKGQ